MTNRQIVARTINAYARGLPSTDLRVRPRYVYYKLVASRSLLLALEAERDKVLSDFNYQTLPCVEMIEVPKHECPCLPPDGCTILRSKHKLPKPIAGYNKQYITEIRSPDGEIYFGMTTLRKERFRRFAEYIGKKSRAFVENDYVYIIIQRSLMKGAFIGRFISLRGIWDDPSAVAAFPNGCAEALKEKEFKSDQLEDCVGFLDHEFPVEGKFIERMIHASLVEMQILKSGIGDQAPNNKEDLPR